MPPQKHCMKIHGQKLSKIVGVWRASTLPSLSYVGLAWCTTNLGGIFRLRMRHALHRQVELAKHTHSA